MNKRRGTSTILAAAALMLTAPAGGLAMAHGDGAHDAEPLCTAFLGLKAQFESDEPDSAAVEQLMTDAVSAAPEDLAASVDIVVTELQTTLDSGGEADPFESPEFVTALGDMDAWAFESCTFDSTYRVTATEFAFGGLPFEIPAGNVAILVANIGEQSHEMIIVRRLDGVTETWDELLALPDEEIESKIDFISAAWLPAHGSQGMVNGEFVPGDYLALCFVSDGSSVSADGEETEGTGEPHVMHGMKQEFTVTG